MLTPGDEFAYWADCTRSGHELTLRERAQHFLMIFNEISGDFQSLDSLLLPDLVELVEKTQVVLDDIWKQAVFDAYPQKRMKHLLNVIGDTLARAVQKQLSTVDIWHAAFSDVRDALRNGLTVCHKWLQLTEELTDQFWSADRHHPWTLGKHSGWCSH